MDALTESFVSLFSYGVGLGLVLWFGAFAGGVVLSCIWHIITRS